MTKKDYVKIAKIIKEEIRDIENNKRVAYRFADMLKEDNRRFNQDRFLTAAMGE